MHLKCVYGLAGCFGFVLTWVGLCTWGKAGGRWGQGWMAGVGLSKRRMRRRGVGQGSSSLAPLLQKKKKEKKTAYGLAAWLGICDSDSPACHICQGHCGLSQSACNQSLTTHDNWRGSLKSIWLICVFVRPWPRKGVHVLWLEAVPWGLLQRKVKNFIWKPSHIKHSSSVSKRIFALERGWLLIIRGLAVESGTFNQQKCSKCVHFQAEHSCGLFFDKSCCKMCFKGQITCWLMTFYVEPSSWWNWVFGSFYVTGLRWR